MDRGACLALAALLVLGGCDTLITGYGGMGTRQPYRESIEMKVGESAVLNHLPATCDAEEAPDWQAIVDAGLLDPTDLGAYSDAGAGWSYADGCVGPVHARAVRFTALQAGEETLVVFGDPVALTVAPSVTGATRSSPPPAPRPPA